MCMEITVCSCPDVCFSIPDHRSHASEWLHGDVLRRRVQRSYGQPDAGDGAPPTLSSSLPALSLLSLEDGRPPTTPLQALYRYNGTNSQKKKTHFQKRTGIILWVIFYFHLFQAAARHQCSALVCQHVQEFEQIGVCSDWLRGLEFCPQRLRNLNEINKILAHRPWLITKQHIQVKH